MLIGIFGLKRDGMVGGWRKLHSKELRNLYSLPNTIYDQAKEDEMGRACGIHGEKKMHTGFWWESLKVRDC